MTPITLPDLPPSYEGWITAEVATIEAYARAAVEVDRAGNWRPIHEAWIAGFNTAFHGEEPNEAFMKYVALKASGQAEGST